MRFTGRERHSVDAKGRLSMPKHFRDAIYEEAHAKTANLLVMVPWFDECVRVFPLATWSDRIAQMEQQLLGFDTLGYSHEESDLSPSCPWNYRTIFQVRMLLVGSWTKRNSTMEGHWSLSTQILPLPSGVAGAHKARPVKS